MKLAIFVVFKASAIENTNVKARVKEKRNRFLNQNSNLRASVGLFNFDLVATIFGAGSMLSRIVYIVVGLASLYMIYFAVKDTTKMSTHTATH